MLTNEEIERTIDEADAARTAARKQAATQVHDLAAERDVTTAQLVAIDQKLNEAVVAARAVMELDELMTFTGRTKNEVEAWASMRPAHRAKGRARVDAGAGRRSRGTADSTVAGSPEPSVR